MAYFDVLRRKSIWEWLEGYKHVVQGLSYRSGPKIDWQAVIKEICNPKIHCAWDVDSNAKEWSWNSVLKIVWFVWPLGTANMYLLQPNPPVDGSREFVLRKMKSRLLTFSHAHTKQFLNDLWKNLHSAK